MGHSLQSSLYYYQGKDFKPKAATQDDFEDPSIEIMEQKSDCPDEASRQILSSLMASATTEAASSSSNAAVYDFFFMHFSSFF